MFVGVSHLAQASQVVYAHGQDQESVLSLIARAVFHDNDALRATVLFSTALILVLAANTAYADFPRLSAILARDGFAPRQLTRFGDRLVYSNGIILLGVFAALLVIVFRGQTDRLIPLYAEHLDVATKRHDHIRLDLNRRRWTISVNDGPVELCTSCTRSPDHRTYRFDAQSLCRHCARRALR